MVQLSQKEDLDSNLCDLGSYFPLESIFSSEKCITDTSKGYYEIT